MLQGWQKLHQGPFPVCSLTPGARQSLAAQLQDVRFMSFLSQCLNGRQWRGRLQQPLLLLGSFRGPERSQPWFLFCLFKFKSLLNLLQYFFLSPHPNVLVFWLWGMWVLSSLTRDQTIPAALEGEVLTTGLPRKSPKPALFKCLLCAR